jgi:hypothetical protein
MTSSSTVVRCAARLARTRRRGAIVGLALIWSCAALIGASPASAGLQQEFAVFNDCPLANPAVSICVYSTTGSGEFKIGSKTVPIDKTVILQGGLTSGSEELVPAADGNTLSKTALTLPGGLVGLEVLPPLTEVTATAEIAGPVLINVPNFGKQSGTAVTLPLKVKLDNPLLLSSCYIGSEAEPLTPHLTTGTTAPPSPATPLQGTSGKLEFTAAGKINVFRGSSLVDNTFPAPGANGCAGPLAHVVDPAVDLQAGLPSSAGTNNAVLNGTLEQASAITVKRQREIPEIGRCVKVTGERVGKEILFKGHYVDARCVREFPTAPSTIGKYEWTPGAVAKQFSGAGTTAALETVGKAKITCAGSSNSGEFTGTKTATLGITLTGCKRVSNKEACQSAGAASGEIKASSLQGELGFIKDAVEAGVLNVSVGFDLKHEPAIVSGECGAAKESLVITGSVIAPVAIDKMATSNTLKFKATGGKQAPESFEEEPRDTLSAAFAGGSPEQAGLTSSQKITYGEKLEIKAIAE